MQQHESHRVSPLWVRRMPQDRLHVLALSLRRRGSAEDLTERQEWLWRACISELMYRRRRERRTWKTCSCELCIPPFEDEGEQAY